MSRSVLLVLICLASTGFPEALADSDCGPTSKDTGESMNAASFLRADGLDLACCPNTLFAPEGKWTFFLRGRGALSIDGAQLVVDGKRIAARRVTYPTTNSALVDFEYDPLPTEGTAELKLLGEGAEICRFTIPLVEGHPVPPDRRQKYLVRVQLRPGAIEYPLHGFRGRGGVSERHVWELGGDEEFCALLAEMGIEKLRKVMTRYAEDDSIHWDPRHDRELLYAGTQLRQYIFYLGEERSEAAYKEIFLALDDVEGAYINEDRRGGKH